MSNVIHLKNKRNNNNRNDNSNRRGKGNINNKYKNNKKPSTGKYLLIVAFGLAIILAIATRVFRVEKYEIEGNRLYSDEEILKILEIGPNSNMMKVYMNANKDLKTYPYIEDVEVKFISYNKVGINVFEKQIIGYLLYMSQYLCVDKDGYIVDYVDPENLDEQISVIEGITSDTLVLGEKINIPEEIINICYLFHKAEIKYGLSIDVINFNNNRSENIVLSIKDTNVEFGDMNFFNEKIQTIMDILPQIPENEKGTLFLGNNGRTCYYKKNLE